VNAGIEVVFRDYAYCEFCDVLYFVFAVCVFLGQGRCEHRYRGGIQRIYILRVM
jgi:hypothetical protein